MQARTRTVKPEVWVHLTNVKVTKDGVNDIELPPNARVANSGEVFRYFLKNFSNRGELREAHGVWTSDVTDEGRVAIVYSQNGVSSHIHEIKGYGYELPVAYIVTTETPEVIATLSGVHILTAVVRGKEVSLSRTPFDSLTYKQLGQIAQVFRRAWPPELLYDHAEHPQHLGGPDSVAFTLALPRSQKIVGFGISDIGGYTVMSGTQVDAKLTYAAVDPTYQRNGLIGIVLKEQIRHIAELERPSETQKYSIYFNAINGVILPTFTKQLDKLKAEGMVGNYKITERGTEDIDGREVICLLDGK